MPGSGKRANDCSKPGYGWPGARPAPLSNRIRTDGNASNAVRAAARLGLPWIGSGGSVTPLTPITPANTAGASAFTESGMLRSPLRDVELQEVVPAVERLRVERVGVHAVGEREPLALGAGEAPRERRAVAAGLLVGPLAGEVGRRLDLVHERDRRQRVGDALRTVVAVGPHLGEQVERLGVQRLVGLARLVAALDPVVRPPLAAGGGGRPGVVARGPSPTTARSRC